MPCACEGGLAEAHRGYGSVVYQSVSQGADIEKGKLIKLTLKN